MLNPKLFAKAISACSGCQSSLNSVAVRFPLWGTKGDSSFPSFIGIDGDSDGAGGFWGGKPVGFAISLI